MSENRDVKRLKRDIDESLDYYYKNNNNTRYINKIPLSHIAISHSPQMTIIV